MKARVAYVVLMLTLCIGGATIWKDVSAKRDFGSRSTEYAATWDPRAAERYLDSREVWWQQWPSAQTDHRTVCVSCHTVLPYALAQPVLRRQLGANEPEPPEEVMLTSIESRVSNWSRTIPYYTDAADGPGKTQESQATEAVLNAVILAHYDAEQGQLRPLTRKAFEEAWALQLKNGDDAGGWRWQDFHLAPWESTESAYQGAALMAIAVGSAPNDYASESDVRDNLESLKEYLHRRYDGEPLMSKLYVLWASARIAGLLTEDQRSKLIRETADLELNDGGWALSSLDEQSRKQAFLDEWKRLTHTAKSDGCATGLVVVALKAAEMDQGQAPARRGLEWLESHQAKDGTWWATSLNGPRDEDSDIGRFMSDAATGYAVLALESGTRTGPKESRR